MEADEYLASQFKRCQYKKQKPTKLENQKKPLSRPLWSPSKLIKKQIQTTQFNKTNQTEIKQ